jgi:branched-chain amino acid transport system ATP-binding protein
MPSLLQAADLTKRYGGIVALDGVSLGVEAGELLGVIGPNGSGKSTLFDCITGLVAADAGTVELRGRPIHGQPVHRIASRGLVRSFQKTTVFGSLSALENLVVAGQAHAFGSTWRTFALGRETGRVSGTLVTRALALLDRLALADVARERGSQLSFGQQKLVQFASCLMLEPEVVLLDEPLAGVNLVIIERMVEMIRRLNADAGTTFVVIEHNIDVLLSLCRRVVVLARGRVLAEGAPEAVARDPRVIEAYLGG